MTFDDLTTVPQTRTASRLDDEDERKAALAVADRATSPADCRLLLDALGLLPGSSSRLADVVHGMPGYRLGCRCDRCRIANAKRTRKQRAALVTTTAEGPINTTTGGTS